MKTLFNTADRDMLLERLDRLGPEHRARWGRMTAADAICHVALGLRLGLSDSCPRAPKGLMATFPVNWALIHVIPWPRGAKTAPELLDFNPSGWDQDVCELRRLVHDFSTRGPDAAWPSNVVFGRISGRSWGALQYKHLDHHLRQFGV